MEYEFSLFMNPVTTVIPQRNVMTTDVSALISGPAFKQITEKLRKEKDPKLKRFIKAHEFPFVTFSGTFTKRSEKGLIKHSGLICFDFDHVGDVKEVRRQLLQDALLPVCLLFDSPSADGVKSVVKVDIYAASHLDYFRAISAYLERTYGLMADASGKDIPRPCFLPYDPTVYCNAKAEAVKLDLPEWLAVADEIHPVSKPHKQLSFGEENKTAAKSSPKQKAPRELNTLVQIERMVDDVVAKKIALADSYEEWVQMAFSLASLGEAGRAPFLRCCDLYPKDQEQSPDKLFSYCLQHRNGSVGIGTFFKKAADAGVMDAGVTDTEEEKKIKSLPTIPDEAIEHLPPLLASIYATGTSKEISDALVLTAIATFSGAMPNVVGHYAGREHTPHLYISILGGASVGKGQIALCRRLVNKIHKELHANAMAKYEEYLRELDVFLNKKGPKKESDRPKKPANSMLFIPVNNSSSGFLSLLQQNKGRGIFFETEIDVMNDAAKTEYGNLSVPMRYIFHNEVVSYNRRKDDEYHEIENPGLAVILTGTKDQLFTLIPNAKNGLFSRFMFYNITMKPVWNDVFAFSEHTLEQTFDEFGEEFYDRYKFLEKRTIPILFRLTPEQQDRFNTFFAKTQAQYFELCGEDYISVVRRLGLIGFRMGMVFTVLRAENFSPFDEKCLVCSDEDFNSIMLIIQTVISHAAFVFNELPEGKTVEKPRGNLKMDFYQALPDVFDRVHYLALGDKIGLKPRTCDKRIERFVSTQLLVHEGNLYFKAVRNEKSSE